MTHTPPKTLLHILSGYGPGGTRTMFLHYQKALCDAGYSAIPCVRKASFMCQELKKHGYTPELMDYSRSFISTATAKKLRNIYYATHATWILVHNAKDASLWRMLLPEVFIILILHEEVYTALQSVDVVLTVNPVIRDNVLKRHPQKHCMCIPNCVDAMPMLPHIPHQKLHLGYLGKIRRSKGIFILLRALALLPTHVSWHLTVQGEGPSSWFARLFAIVLGIHSRITWKSWQENKDFFQNIDILIVPSLKESFGLVILEALMMGRHVIATTAQGPSMILETLGLHSNLCAPTADALSQKLLEVILEYPNVPTVTPASVIEHFSYAIFLKHIQESFTTIDQYYQDTYHITEQ